MLHDVAIVGAGPVGSTLALALAAADDVDIVVLDERPPGQTLRGDRSLALSHGARLILERLSAWSALSTVPGAATPITRIDVSQSGGFGRLTLTAEEQGLPALGYVVSYRALQAALDAALARTGVAVRHGAGVTSVGGAGVYAAVELEGPDTQPVLARLAAIADGSGAAMPGIARQRHEYGQVAVVGKLWRDAPHDGVACERFTPVGPIALLPEGDHYGLVWTVTANRASELATLDDAAFLGRLAHHFGARAGSFLRVADRREFPLVLDFAREPAAARCVALGNAAQTLHPVAGQGFNVGLRDAWVLADVALDTPREELGDRAMLERYLRARRTDRIAGIAFTHGLVNIFGNDLALLRWPRGLALTLLDAVPAAKRAFARAMVFGLR